MFMVQQDYGFTDFRISEAHPARVAGFFVDHDPGGIDSGQFLLGHSK
jgi:hypothetical protein